MKRLYQSVIEQHLQDYQQMAFLPGPRQVGKTTLTKQLSTRYRENLYLNWDYPPDRTLILSGADKVINKITSHLSINNEKPLVVFDEIHKYKNWKNYLKGYYDYAKDQTNTLVTGSAKLDIYKKGGDSLMGRYFLYHIHPFSTAELIGKNNLSQEINEPKKIDDDSWHALYTFGGFPDPLLQQNKLFLNRWQQLRFHQLFIEDIRTLQNVSDLSHMEVLAKMLNNLAGSQMQYHSLATKIQVSDKTVKRWIEILKSFYYCFTIKPWSKNINRSLIKEPKIYLWDWSMIENEGAKIENFVACHLLKAVHFWQDMGFGKYQLYYLRDKEQREVDFLITKDDKPWIMVEVKSSNNQSVNKNLCFFQQHTQAPHAFQVVFDLPYIDNDCFTAKKPIIVPAKTFLSQLV